MIKVYSNYVACETHAEAIKAQAIITNAICHIPIICNDGIMFLLEHELGEYKMQELLNQDGLSCKLEDESRRGTDKEYNSRANG